MRQTYRVYAESSGGFLVEAENVEQAEEMVLDHMYKTGTPFLSGPGVAVLPSGGDKVLEVSQVTNHVSWR